MNSSQSTSKVRFEATDGQPRIPVWVVIFFQLVLILGETAFPAEADQSRHQQADQKSGNQTVETQARDPAGECLIGSEIVPAQDCHQSRNHTGDDTIAGGS